MGPRVEKEEESRIFTLEFKHQKKKKKEFLIAVSFSLVEVRN
jgi:hypothetical protein